jgi:hypothetical protein
MYTVTSPYVSIALWKLCLYLTCHLRLGVQSVHPAWGILISLTPCPFRPSWFHLPRRVQIMRLFSFAGVETSALQIGKRRHRLSLILSHNFCRPFIFLCS